MGPRMHHRLQIALVFVAPVLLLAALYAVGLALGVRAPLLGRGYVIRIELPDPEAPVGLPKIEGAQDTSRPLVVIDAGHGGHDPGASGAGTLGGLKEKTLTLALALALRDELVREGGVRVALTRSDDRFLVLDERAEIARELGADLFLSIHADSAGEQAGISGASVYTLSATASSGLEMNPASNSAEGTSGARSTTSAAARCACGWNASVPRPSRTISEANSSDRSCVRRCDSSTRIALTFSSSARRTPLTMSALFSRAAKRAAASLEAVAESV